MKRSNIGVTFAWVSGLLVVFAVGILWLGVLGLAIFTLYRAYGKVEGGNYVTILVLFTLVLTALGALFVRCVNRFYDWWLEQRVNSLMCGTNPQPEISVEQQFNSLVDKYESEVSLEFSETFKRALQSSPTFQNTVREATKLVLEVLIFSNVPHTEEERKTFRNVWQAKVEKFAKQVAEGDPLATEVILSAIEKESQKERIAGK